MSKRILSTKILRRNQKELLLNAGFGLVEQNFIAIHPLKFETEKVAENLIFTSRNAVKAILAQPKAELLKQRNCYSVGEKTSTFLRENGFSVKATAHYGKDLAERIISENPEGAFTFFCGKKRNPDLPEILKQNNINFSEIAVYDTELSPKKIDCIFDGVLFFSPSAVQSYFSVNKLPETTAFCIGETTASEAKEHTSNIIIASTPSIENVIVKVIKHFNQQ